MKKTNTMSDMVKFLNHLTSLKRENLLVFFSLILLIAPLSLLAQTYTVSPSGWTSVPSADVTQGTKTLHGKLLQVKATVSGRTATFTLKKNDGGQFKNRGSIFVRSDSYSGRNVRDSEQYNAGVYNPTVDVDLDFTSGSKTYVIVLSSKASETIYYYSNPITITAKSSPQVNLVMASTGSFGTTTLTKGKEYTYTVKVKNNGSSSWSGAFYLKSGSTNWISWSKSISAGSTITLTGTYTPTTTGSHSLKLYYQTGGSGDGVLVPAGSYSNPISVTVSDATNLSLASTGSFGTTTLTKGKEYTYTVKVKNNSSSSWSGAFYLKSGSTNWISWSKSISAGGTITLTGTYTPTTTGSHTLKLYYQTGGSGDGFLVPAGSYSNSVSVTVADALATPSYTTFSATNITTTGFTANWGSVSGATKYNINVKKATDSDYSNTVFSKTGITSTSCNVTNLQPGTSYHFQIQAENSSQKSSWSKSIANAITTKQEAVNLVLASTGSFGTTTLTKGKEYTYTVKVKNNSSSSWSGAFYLKSGSTNWISWSKSISAGGTITLTGTYTPTTTGSHTLKLYYQTGGSGDGFPVPAGSYSNSVSVTVAESANLALASTGSFGTTTLTKGKSYTFSVKVKNNGSSSWSGAFYLKSGSGNTNWLSWSKTINAGSVVTLTDTYTPTTTGNYTLTLYYQTGGTGDGFKVPEGSYSNPITVTVSDNSYALATPDYTQFSADNRTSTGFRAKWSSVSGATKYGILVRKVGGSYTNPDFEDEVTSTSCNVTNLQPNTSYEFQIQARNSNGQKSEWSKSIATPVTTLNNLPTTSTYMVSPSGYTNVPSANVLKGSRTLHGGLIQVKASVSGNTATFTLRKNDGSQFKNKGNLVVYAGNYNGDVVKSNVSYAAGIYNPTVDVNLDFTSGTRKYVVVIKSGDTFYYTEPITISTRGMSSEADLVIAGGSYFNTSILTTGKEHTFAIKIKNNGSATWNGSFFLKYGKENWLEWYDQTISAGSTKTLTKSYIPKTAGKKTLILYYQTGGSGDGIEVPTGGYDNPFTVTVADPPSTNKLATPDKNTFKATNITETGFTASWGAVTGAVTYNINVRKVGGDYNTPVYKDGTSKTYIDVKGLEPGTSYEFQIRARNGIVSQNSDWSASIPTPVTTKKAGTEPANLSIYAVRGFDGKTPLTVGVASTYKVYVVNNGASDWFGSFYLKDGDKNLNAWYKIPLVGNAKAVQPLEFNYIPESAGTKTLTLYYQTNTSGGGLPVNAGNGTNPMTINIKNDPSVNENLKLMSAITYPATLELGQKGTISAKVQNAGGENWYGKLYLTDNGVTIASVENLTKGQSKTIYTTNWEPQTAGTHTITVYYESTNSNRQRLVTTNGFANPVYSSVERKQIDLAGNTVNLKYLTKEVTPRSVTEGTEVYYHYKVTDMNGNPVKGIKAVFSPVGNNSIKVNTNMSDDDGFLTLCLKTEGNEAVASPGTSVTLSCIDIVKNDGQHLVISGANSSEHNVSLSVLKKTTFENAEKVNLSIDLGLTAKAEFYNYLKGNASVSIPLQFGWQYDESNNFSHYNFGVGIKGEVGCKADLGKVLKALKGVEASGKAAVGYESSYQHEEFKPIIQALVYNVCNILPPTTDWLIKYGADVYKAWYEESNIAKPVVTQNGFLNLSFGAGYNYTFNYPTSPGLPNKIARLPQNIGITDFAIKGDAAVKWAFLKTKEDFATKEKTYCNSSSLKFNVEGDIKRVINNDMILSKCFWLNSSIYDFYQSKILYFLQYKSLVADKKLTLSFKEDEEYKDEAKKYLTKASHSISWTSGYELSIDELVLKKGWVPLGGSVRYSTTCSSKVTLGKGYIDYLHTKVLNNDKDKNLICMAIPAFSATSLISEPNKIYNAWKYDYFKPLTQICIPNAPNYSLKESMKVEQTNSSKVGFTVNIPIYDFKVAKLSLDVGAELELENRPSVSYYSVENNRFFPIVLRPATSITGLVNNITKTLTEGYIEKSFEEHEESLNTKWTLMKSAQYGTGYVNNDIPVTFTTMNTGHTSILNAKTGDIYDFVKRRSPALAAKRQIDICAFTFVFNNDIKNFYEDTNFEFSHFYPAGDLLGVTDEGDTLFVVSEVCNLIATQGTDTLKSTQYGQFKLDSTIGVDDLTPFGIQEDAPLDIYYSEKGSKIWHYVGPAGTTIMTDQLGAYMMATSIKNDVVCPEILANLDEQSGILHIKVNDNMGLRVNTLSILLNGVRKDVTAINESSFELYLSEEEMQYMFTLYITVNDLAGNQGSLFQIYNIDKDDPDDIKTTESEKNKAEILLSKNSLKVEGAEPEDIIMLFSLKGDVVAKGKADNSGKAQIRLNHLSPGVYVVTLSSGKAKKFLLK